jgi:hypothetical protein
VHALLSECKALQIDNARLLAMAEADAFEIGRVKEENIRLEAELKAANVLARFGLAVLEEARIDLGDVDGGWLQDKALELGALHKVPVTEPCNDPMNELSVCRCAEWDDFPQDCIRDSPVTDAVRAAHEGKGAA